MLERPSGCTFVSVHVHTFELEYLLGLVGQSQENFIIMFWEDWIRTMISIATDTTHRIILGVSMGNRASSFSRF